MAISRLDCDAADIKALYIVQFIVLCFGKLLLLKGILFDWNPGDKYIMMDLGLGIDSLQIIGYLLLYFFLFFLDEVSASRDDAIVCFTAVKQQNSAFSI